MRIPVHRLNALFLLLALLGIAICVPGTAPAVVADHVVEFLSGPLDSYNGWTDDLHERGHQYVEQVREYRAETAGE